MLCTILDSVSGLYPLDISSASPPVVTAKDVSDAAEGGSPWWAELPASPPPPGTITAQHTALRSEMTPNSSVHISSRVSFTAKVLGVMGD